MSKVLNKNYKGRYWCDIVQTDRGNTYIVDSGLTCNRRFETKVFKYDQEADKVVSWTDLRTTWCKTYNEMKVNHEKVCTGLEEYLSYERR